MWQRSSLDDCPVARGETTQGRFSEEQLALGELPGEFIYDELLQGT